MKALVSGHPRDAKKVSVTKAGHLRECKNIEFVWELRKTGFYEGGRKYDVRFRECLLGELPLYSNTSLVFQSHTVLLCSLTSSIDLARVKSPFP